MKSLILCIFSAVLMIFSCGCYDYNELKNYTIVMGIGIDTGKEYKYKVTAELGSISESGENVRESQSSVVIVQQANSIEQAVALLTDTTGGELYFKNCEIAVIGKALCNNGISDVIDFLIESPAFQKNMSVAVSGGLAADVFSIAPTTDNLISTELAKSIESGEKSLSNTHKITPFEIYESNTRGEHCVLPTLNIKSDAKDTVEAGGFVVLEDWKGICDISSEDAVYYSFLCSSVSRAVIEVGTDDDSFGCEITKAKTETNGEEILIEVHASAFDTDNSDAVQKQILSGVEKVAQKMRDYNVSDVPSGEIVVDVQLSNRQQTID